MNVNPTTLHNLYKANMAKPRRTGEYQEAKFSGITAAGTENTDRISISSQGSYQKDVRQMTKSTMQEVVRYSSPERLEEIRGRIASNTYFVSTGDVADAIMGRVLGD